MDRLLHWGLGIGSAALALAVAAQLAFGGGEGNGGERTVRAVVPLAAPSAGGMRAEHRVASARARGDAGDVAPMAEQAEVEPPAPALSDADQRQAALANALAARAEVDPRSALLQASALDLGPASSYVRGNLLGQWAVVDFDGALDYAERQPPGEAREEMLGRLAIRGTSWSPADAARMISDEMAAGPARDEAAIAVVHRWALGDPDGAATWAASFPDAALRDRALREIAGTVAAAP